MPGLEGKHLADCEILARVGQGGMGTVYKARQVELDRFVAIKVLAAQLGHDADFLTRFKREAAAAAQLVHPNIVQVFYAGHQEETHYFVMEFVDGESVQQRLLRVGRLPPVEALAICAAVAQGLDYAWRRSKLIHRDIKPDNIFLSHAGEVKLGDLGLAKYASGTNSSLTITGSYIGTPYFVSPEQARGAKEIDFRADLYSLGCTLFYMVTGKLPYGSEGCDALSLMYQHVHEPPPDIMRVWPECPAPLAQLIGRMIQKKPDDRFQSYEELLAEFKRVSAVLQGGGVPHVTLPGTVAPVADPVPASAPTMAGPATAAVAKRDFRKVYAVAGAVLILAALAFWPPKKPAVPPSRDVDAAYLAQVAALPAEQQVASVVAKLKELNSGYDGKESHQLEGGRVSALTLPAISLRDLTPLRALPALKAFTCNVTSLKLSGKQPKGALADLAPLKGLALEKLDCSQTEVADLAPLTGMPLKQVLLDGTKIRDLTPLAQAPLEVLRCDFTPLRDLTPLAGLPLRELYCASAVAVEKSNRKMLTALKTLEKINGVPIADFWQHADPNAPETGESARQASTHPASSYADFLKHAASASAVGDWKNLAASVVPQRDSIAGGWRVENGRLLCTTHTNWAFCELPVDYQGGSYDLRYRVTRGAGDDIGIFCFFRKDRWGGAVGFDCIFPEDPLLNPAFKAAGLFRVNGKRVPRDEPRTERRVWLPRGEERTVLIQVREEGVVVSLEGEVVFAWQGPWADMRQTDGPVAKGRNRPPIFGLSIFQCEAVFSIVEMRPVVEKGSE